jgi:hypothetical protein
MHAASATVARARNGVLVRLSTRAALIKRSLMHACESQASGHVPITSPGFYLLKLAGVAHAKRYLASHR